MKINFSRQDSIIVFYLLPIIVFFVSVFQCYQEIKFSLYAKPAVAYVVGHSEGGHKFPDKVWYRFLNENSDKAVKGFMRIDKSEFHKFPKNSELGVEYYGNAIFVSRRAGGGQSIWFILLALSAGILVYQVRKWLA